MSRIIYYCCCALLGCSNASLAQSTTGPAGHWDGSITLPTMELKVLVDLARDAGGQWIGDIDIPQQGAKDLPLKNVSVADNLVSFDLTAGPGDPKFKGKLSEDGSSLRGEFTQGGATFPFALKRAGEARVFVPAKNAELPARFIGNWEGSLATPAGNLRLVFHLANKAGSASGTIDSLDQGAMGIPLDEIAAADNSIKIGVRIITGSYTGKLSEDGKTLAGNWSQGGGTLPLVLTRAGM